MADEWDEFGDADPWSEFNDAPKKKRKVSQTQGFIKGVSRVGKNLAPLMGGIPGGYGLSSPMAFQSASALDAIKTREGEGIESGQAGQIAGEIAASSPLALVGGPMTGGALQGYASSRSDTIGGKLRDAAIGAVAGKVGEKVIKGAASYLRPATPAANVLREADVPLTPGQSRGGRAMRLEDKLMSRPVVGDAIRADREASLIGFNRSAVDRALAPLGIKVPDHVPTGSDAVAFAQRTLNDAYEAVVPKISVKVDPRFLAGMRDVAKRASALPEAQQKQLEAILHNIKFGEGGALAGARAKAAQSELQRLSSGYRSSAVESERQLGQTLGAVKDELEAMIVRQNSAVAPELQKVNKAWRGLAIVEDAASRADDGLFSTGQLKAAVRRSDTTRRKRATAAGRAYLQDFSNAARTTLPSKVPDSGTPERLMSGNILAQVKGAADLIGYKGRKATTNFLAANPGIVGPVSNFLELASDPFGRLTGTAAAQRPRD